MGKIQTKPSTKAYREGWDSIYGNSQCDDRQTAFLGIRHAETANEPDYNEQIRKAREADWQMGEIV